MRLLSRKSVTIQPHHPHTLIDDAISKLKYELTFVQSITPGFSGRFFPSRLVAVCEFPAEGVEVPGTNASPLAFLELNGFNTFPPPPLSASTFLGEFSIANFLHPCTRNTMLLTKKYPFIRLWTSIIC